MNEHISAFVLRAGGWAAPSCAYLPVSPCVSMSVCGHFDVCVQPCVQPCVSFRVVKRAMCGLQLVSFTRPIKTDNWALMVVKPTDHVDLLSKITTLFLPFSNNLWLVLLGMMAVSGMLFGVRQYTCIWASACPHTHMYAHTHMAACCILAWHGSAWLGSRRHNLA